jgi:hypothetical protein
MSQFLRALAKGTPEDLEKAIQDYNVPMMSGVEQVEPAIEEAVRQHALEQPEMLQEEIDHPGLTDEEFAAQIRQPGVVGSGRRTPDEMNELRGQEGLEPDKPKTLLDELRGLRQQSDKELEHARTMDAMSQLINTLAPLHENRMRARAMRSAQSIGADPGKLNLPQMPTDSASKQLAERSQRIKDLLSQFQLESSLQPKPLSELDRAKIEAEKAKAEKYRADAQKTQDKFEDKEALKEQTKIKAENRKERKNVEKDVESTEKLLKDLEHASSEFEKYSKKSPGGTGPIATLGGLTKNMSADTESLDALFKQQNLETMTKMFAGMSKAVDSDAERRAFEAAQPSITNDDRTNRDIFRRRISAAKELLKKQKQTLKSIDKDGNIKEPEEDDNVVKLKAPNGEVRLVKRSQMQKYIDKGATLVED